MAEAALTLPDEIVSWVGEANPEGGLPHTDRIPGGAMREAWFVDVRMPRWAGASTCSARFSVGAPAGAQRLPSAPPSRRKWSSLWARPI